MFTFAHDAVGSLREWLRAERDVPECPAPRRAAAARYVEAARLRLRPARDVWSSPRPVVAATLLRDAVALLALAATAARGVDANDAPPSELLAPLRASAGEMRDEGDAIRVDAALQTHDPLFFDALDDDALRETLGALKREAAWLERRVDLRSPTYMEGTRIGRQVGLALLVLWLGYRALAPLLGARDLALDRPVRASSHQVGTPDPSGLVDGKIGDTYGFHTQVSAPDPSWAIIDLGAETPIRKIVVYNRSDVNLDDGLPFSLDVSSDGASFREVARREAHFGDGTFLSPPWTAKMHERARYVRIRSPHYMALNEVEVF
jgi:hypothetical protein